MERAQKEAERLANPTAEEIAAAAAAKLAAEVAKPQCQKILRLVEERGVVGSREIESALGWAKGAAGNWLPYLREAGLIVGTTASPVAKNARYRLAGEVTREQAAGVVPPCGGVRQRHPNGQAVLTFLGERGEVTSAEVAASCGFGQGTAKRWLNRLVELGLVTRHFEGIKGQLGGRRVVYHLAQPSNEGESDEMVEKVETGEIVEYDGRKPTSME